MKKIIFFAVVIFAQGAYATDCKNSVAGVVRKVELLSDNTRISGIAWKLRVDDIYHTGGRHPRGVLKACILSCSGEQLIYCDKVLSWLTARKTDDIPHLGRKKLP